MASFSYLFLVYIKKLLIHRELFLLVFICLLTYLVLSLSHKPKQTK